MRISYKDTHMLHPNMTVEDRNAPTTLKNEEMLLGTGELPLEHEMKNSNRSRKRS